MTEARVEKEFADRVTAREFLGQAEIFLADAAQKHLRPESQVVLLHNAAIAACDAILQVVGLRVTGGDGSHILRLETALGQLDQNTEELLERLNASRERRSEASYRATIVALASVEDAREATSELLELARQFVD